MKDLALGIVDRLARAALMVGVSVAIVAGTLLLGPGTPTRALATGMDFTITSAISAYPECTGSGLLFPGVDRCLIYQVHDNLAVPITVVSLAIASVAAPPDCPASNLDLTRTTFTGALSVPASGTADAPGLPILLLDTTANQNACRIVTFTFAYAGAATTQTPTATPPPTSTEGSRQRGSGSGLSTLLLLACLGLTAAAALVAISRRTAAKSSSSAGLPVPATPSATFPTARRSGIFRSRRSGGPGAPPPSGAVR